MVFGFAFHGLAEYHIEYSDDLSCVLSGASFFSFYSFFSDPFLS